jgi:hypothetical protein
LDCSLPGESVCNRFRFVTMNWKIVFFIGIKNKLVKK